MAKISGVLRDPSGRPIPNCIIELKALKTTLTTITRTISASASDRVGFYSMNVEPGEYQVSLNIAGYPLKHAGQISVYSDSLSGTLNNYLIESDTNNLTPEVILIFQQLKNEAQQAAEQAGLNAQQALEAQTQSAGIYENAANISSQIDKIARELELTENAAVTDANSAQLNAQQTAQEVKAIESLKTQAEQANHSAQSAQRDAEQSAIQAQNTAASVQSLAASVTSVSSDKPVSAQWDTVNNTLKLEVPTGLSGKKGKTVYDLWLEAGNTGSEEDFINSIQGGVGSQGVKGDKGDTGSKGEKGELGAKGEAAEKLILSAATENGSSLDGNEVLITLKRNTPRYSFQFHYKVKLNGNLSSPKLHLLLDPQLRPTDVEYSYYSGGQRYKHYRMLADVLGAMGDLDSSVYSSYRISTLDHAQHAYTLHLPDAVQPDTEIDILINMDLDFRAPIDEDFLQYLGDSEEILNIPVQSYLSGMIIKQDRYIYPRKLRLNGGCSLYFRADPYFPPE